MSEEVLLRPASGSDRPVVVSLLTGAGLPLEGVPDDLAGFCVAEAPGRGVIGVAGLESYGEFGLLRSVAVSPAFRAHGIGARLVAFVLGRAEAEGRGELFLLTTTARDWFARFGFEDVARAALPTALFASAELRGACPDTAQAMRRVVT